MNAEVLDCLEDYVKLLQLAGRIDSAVRVTAATTAIRKALRLPRPPHRETETQARMRAARADLGDGAFEAAWSAGRTSALDEAIEQALASTNVPAVTV